ncbi:MAG: M23 family metallopeptidase [Thermotogae bacterium]|nr:M23 family metallopeptidase [Thermotogota bacterium]HOO74465.1 M23 family metallopeptidase [Tepiditoga sp.]
MHKKFIFFIVFLLINSLNFSLIYYVKSGDTLTGISEKFSVDIPVLIENNKELTNKKYLVIGQKIYIPSGNYVCYKVKSGDYLEKIAKIFFTLPEVITEYNNIKNPDLIRRDQILKIPFESVGICYNNEQNVGWPVVGIITSEYGYRIHPIYKVRKFHSGIDIASSLGTPVFSATAGIVSETGYDKDGYGNYIEIKYGKNVYKYGHLSEIDVVSGYVVRKGEMIGKVGSTGLSTGPHLHFEIQNSDGKTYDPMLFLNINIKYAYDISSGKSYGMGGE